MSFFVRRAIPMVALLVVIGTHSATAQDVKPTEEQAKFFETQVRPVLADHCYKCHGPDKQKSGLRLDSLAAMLTGGDTGPAVVPGNVDESPLVQAVLYAEDPKMPPSKKLADAQIDAITQWVKMGAPWPGEEAPAGGAAPVRKGLFSIKDSDREHWAFRPVKRNEPPKVNDASWVKNPVDAFVLAGLDAKGLKPNPPATKLELIRRATYDLTGLPPSPQEVDAFLADSSSDAYEKLVDRLLASPRYGEKWARHWLDLVRFAETNSYERDNPKPSAWRYRDYVIRALNADKPYNRFLREQIAGDELPDRDNDSITATAFYRLGIWDDEPSDREQAEFDSLDDIVATTSQVFLGLTVDCARCHDHKLDPIAQKDYYKLVAFFRNINPYRNGGPTDEAPIVEPGREGETAARVRDLDAKRTKIKTAIASLEDEFRRGYSEGSADLRRPDLEDLRYKFYRDTWDALPAFDAIKHEDAGDLPSGKFDLAPRTRDEAFGFVFEGDLVVPRAGVYTFSLDSDDGSRLIIAGKTRLEYDGTHGEGAEQTAAVELPEGRVPVRLEYFQAAGGFGLNVAWSGPDLAKRPLSAAPSEKGKKAPDIAVLIRQHGMRILGAEHFKEYTALRRQLFQLKNQKATFDATLCVTEAGPKAPETFVLMRGNAHNPGDRVEPGFLTVLGAPEPKIPSPAPGAKTTGRRTILADWITAPENPLTSRVMANRLFQYHFGRGISRSPSNFGLQGDKPTHPEMLDWLASELVAQGWKLKPLHRLLMTSNAYRMSSKSHPDALAKDPTNDSLWRFDMRRLTAEEVRDSILAVTGSLNLAMYGPGVYPEIPKEVLAGQSVPGQGWGKSSPEEQARRSIYVHVKRSLIMPLLEGFDVAETDRSSPVRFSTTQPTQALAMLNGDFLNTQAQAFADRVKREAGDDTSARIKMALRMVTGRDPSEAEVQKGLSLIDTLSKREGVGPEGALRLFCLVALNLNEFLYLD